MLDGARGHVLTNAHVVAGARGVRCTFTDGRTFEAALLGFDEVTDLALLAILFPPNSSVTTREPNAHPNEANERLMTPLPEAPLGDSGTLDVGDWVVAVGNPFGLDSSVTLGIVSALRRSAAEVGIPDKRLDFIQTDAAINPGNSGGPLVNEFGEVVGISTAIRADAEGIGFAIPINTAKGVVAALAAGRPVQHPYLGIQVRLLVRFTRAGVSPFTNAALAIARRWRRRRRAWALTWAAGGCAWCAWCRAAPPARRG